MIDAVLGLEEDDEITLFGREITVLGTSRTAATVTKHCCDTDGQWFNIIADNRNKEVTIQLPYE